MESKIYSYSSDHVEVTWDKKRCIHAKECVHGLPEVFDISKKQWIDPNKTDNIGSLKKVIEACPTGALHYHLKNESKTEQPDYVNTLSIKKDGPLYARGDIQIVDNDEKLLMKDTRVAFCRCGASANKPFCDNSHLNVEFESGTNYNPERLETEPSSGKGGPLIAKLIPNGPFVLEGDYVVKGEDQTTKTEKRMSFCRCGASSNKPFCDGSHRKIGFES